LNILGFSQLTNDEKLSYQRRRIDLLRTCHSKKYNNKIEQDYLNIKQGTNVFRVTRNIRYKRENISFLWCSVPKVGSTSWVTLFLKTWFPKYTGKKHRLLRKKWIGEYDEDFLINVSNKTFSFLITRHPFERLLSAYRNKFVENDKFNEKHGQQIIIKSRKEPPEDPYYKNRPTFREFTDFILHTNVTSMDGHWTPIYNLCMPCHVDYDIIGRLDNIGTDSEEILKNIGIEDHLPTEHVTMNKSSEKTIEEYFSQLDRATLDNLYKVYEMDFVLFKYTIDAFYQFVENKTTLHDG